jgi:hypothetical protein
LSLSVCDGLQRVRCDGQGTFRLTSFATKQLIWALAGIIAMVSTMRIDYHRYRHPGVVFSLLAVTTLLLLSVFLLDRTHHTHRWIRWGGFSFEPSELAKPAIILFMAFFLETRTKYIEDWKSTLLPAVAPTMVFLPHRPPDLDGHVCLNHCVGSCSAGMQLRCFAALPPPPRHSISCSSTRFRRSASWPS